MYGLLTGANNCVYYFQDSPLSIWFLDMLKTEKTIVFSPATKWYDAPIRGTQGSIVDLTINHMIYRATFKIKKYSQLTIQIHIASQGCLLGAPGFIIFIFCLHVLI